MLKILSVGPLDKSLEDYIKKFDITLSVLQTPKSLERAAFELAMDCHDDGVRYLEVRYSPILHTKKGMNLTETYSMTPAASVSGLYFANKKAKYFS